MRNNAFEGKWMLNLIQGLNSNIEGTGQSAETSLLKNGDALTPEAKAQALEFQNLLKSKSENSMLLNTLPENADGLSGSEKEVLQLVGKNSESNVNVKAESLADKLLGQSTGDVVDQKLFAANTESDSKVKATSLGETQNLKSANDLTSLLGKKPAKLKTAGLQIGVNQNILGKEAGLEKVGAKAANADTSFLNKLPNQIQAQPAVKQSMRSFQFSEDFVSTRVDQAMGGKPVVKGKKSAVNLFTKEQAQLDKGGIIKKDSLMNANKSLMSFDSESPLKVNSSGDEIVASKSEVFSNSDNVNQAFSQMNNVKPSMMSSEVMTKSNDVKVLDMSHIDSPDKLIKEISNYIEMNKIQSSRELEIFVNHKDLGQFKVNAQKAGGNMVDLQIVAASDEGRAFFERHEVNMLKTLNNSGVKVSDFKLAMSSDASFSNSSGNDSSGSNNSGTMGQNSRQYNGGQSFSEGGRERRQEMWKQYQDSMDQRLGA